MNKVITIHLHGVAFQLEEGGYDALRTYLDQAERQLAANPDKTEILADIEQAIADKFRALLNTNRNSARTTEVATLIAEIGLVTDSTSSGTDSEPKPDGQPGSTTNAQATDNGAPPKKSPLSCHRGRYRRRRVQRPGCLLRRRRDVRAVGRGRTPVPQSRSGRRRLFHCCQHHPEAKTAEEKAAAGPSPTAQEFIRKARDGYYEGIKAFPNREARREWKRKFRHEMRALKDSCRREMRWHPQWGAPSSAVPPPPAYQVVLPILATLKALLFRLRLRHPLAALDRLGLRHGAAQPSPDLGGSRRPAAGLQRRRCSAQCAPAHLLREAERLATYWSPLRGSVARSVRLLVLALGLWMADRFVPGFHEVLLNVPVFLHNPADAVQKWWAGAQLEK